MTFVEISDLEDDEFIALIDHVLEGSHKTFGMENGAIILEWRTDNAALLKQVQQLFEAYGLRFGIYSKGVVLRVLPTTGRYMAPKFNIL